MELAPGPSKVCSEYVLDGEAQQVPISVRRRGTGRDQQHLEKQQSDRIIRKARVRQTKQAGCRAVGMSGSLSARSYSSRDSARLGADRSRSTSLPLSARSAPETLGTSPSARYFGFKFELDRVRKICAESADKENTMVDSEVASGFMQRYKCQSLLSLLESELEKMESQLACDVTPFAFDDNVTQQLMGAGPQATFRNELEQGAAVTEMAATTNEGETNKLAESAEDVTPKKTAGTNSRKSRRKQLKLELRRLKGV
jgi:hypothetical protein